MTQQYITSEQAATMITDKTSLYKAFQRNGSFMPKPNEPFITIKFLKGAKDGHYFLPKTDNIKKKQCADAPPKKIISQECARVLFNYPDTVTDMTP